MVRNDSLRKHCAKQCIDTAIHQSLAQAGRDPRIRSAFKRLLIQVQNRTDLLRPIPLGGGPSWTPSLGFLNGLLALARWHADWLREAEAWQPAEGSRLRTFGSLARHLLATHPVPHFMDEVWFRDPRPEVHRQQRWFRHLGLGHNIRGTDIPLRLTKTMAHHFMYAPDHYTVEEALRWGQILGQGGSPALVKAVLATCLGKTFEHETYWGQLIRFLIRHADQLTGHVGPIVEYLQFQKCLFRLEPPRSQDQHVVQDLLDRVAKWQSPEMPLGGVSSRRWGSTGIGGLEHIENQGSSYRTWRIRELLSSTELVAEGRAMRHCVGTYADRCVKGKSSVWSMTCHSNVGHQPALTIEINPNNRTIVQAKGRKNAPPPPEARRIMLRWAAQEGIALADGV